MARLSELLPEARIGLSQAPDVSIESALRRSAARFLRETQLWKADLDQFELRTGVETYELQPPQSGAVVEKLVVVRVGSNVVEPVRLSDLRAMPTAGGAPVAAALSVDGREVTFWRKPTAAEAGTKVAIHAALSLERTAREIPNFLADEWHDAVVAGAHAEMYGNKAMPWYDEQKAQERAFRFAEDAARAKRKQHSGGHTELRVRPRPWT
jgi:hypothetical protein